MYLTSCFSERCYCFPARVTARRRAGWGMKILPRASAWSLPFCGTRALLGRPRFPCVDEAAVLLFGQSEPLPFFVADGLETVITRRAGLVAAAPGRTSGLQFQLAQLPLEQGRSRPGVILPFAQQMPDQHGQLAGGRDGSHLVAALRPDLEEESTSGSGSGAHGPGGFDEHGAGVRPSLLGDSTVKRGAFAGLPYPRVEPEIAHQLLWR